MTENYQEGPPTDLSATVAVAEPSPWLSMFDAGVVIAGAVSEPNSVAIDRLGADESTCKTGAISAV